MEPLKHECGIALVRLLKPLKYYEETYGTWMYGLNKVSLMMEKQHNRGQEGAGLACLKLEAEPGEEYFFRERAEGNTAIKQIFGTLRRKFQEYDQNDINSADFASRCVPYAGEIYMGHLRYSTAGKSGLSYVHPFLRRNNWRAKNLCVCANFNMTNADEIFQEIAVKGQHPRMLSDTYILLEQLGHRLDRESERCFQEALEKGLENCDITKYIEDHIDLKNVLVQSSPVWDGGYVVTGITGSGETFTMRDPWGIRPCFWYKSDEVIAVASERPVIQTTFDLDTDAVQELQPGQALLIDKNGNMRLEQILPAQKYAACSFERVYFSRGCDKDIYQERKEMGRQLVEPIMKAINHELDNTVFSFIPNTSEVSYYGMIQGFDAIMNTQKRNAIMRLAQQKDADTTLIDRILSRHVRYEKVAWKDIKMRTFIAEGDARNDLAAHVYDITYNSIVPHEDNLVVIDDSIVRGTTLRESIIRILDRLHPKRIVIVSASPQVRYPDYYGIDMPNMDDLIAFRVAVELIKEKCPADYLEKIYKKCKAQVGLPKEKVVNYVREVYEPFTGDEISEKMVEMLRPEGIDTEIHFVFQSLDGLHRACPHSPGDWYFSGHFPTPGGTMRVNLAFVEWYERVMLKK